MSIWVYDTTVVWVTQRYATLLHRRQEREFQQSCCTLFFFRNLQVIFVIVLRNYVYPPSFIYPPKLCKKLHFKCKTTVHVQSQIKRPLDDLWPRIPEHPILAINQTIQCAIYGVWWNLLRLTYCGKIWLNSKLCRNRSIHCPGTTHVKRIHLSVLDFSLILLDQA